ncbi:hypothetical protein [Leptospira noguchii]|uniref:hypothetical protein n=1 Tax=Leptospira noguchii TaxID=28182 RepID=UPI00077402D2|nr:hypothetical protein [Leptospira noguchii]
MRKTFTAQDLELSRINNHFTTPSILVDGLEEIVLTHPERIFAILNVRASGPWTIEFLNNSAIDNIQEYKRNGNGNEQFTVPLFVDKATLKGISEVSGYFIPVFK